MAGLTVTTLSQASPDDYSPILHLNERAVPAVNSIGAETLAALHRQSAYLGVAHYGSAVVGFLLALPHTAEYDSINFQYFRRHYATFAYVDRIVVASHARNLGVGSALYRDLQRHLADGFPRLTCEVNIEPPNPGSLRFHERLGFRAVATQATEGGKKRVALLVRDLP